MTLEMKLRPSCTANFNSMQTPMHLIAARQSKYNIYSIVSDVQNVWQVVLHPVQHSYNSTNVMNCSSMICLLHFCCFPILCLLMAVLTLVTVTRCLSTIKHLYHKKVLFWLLVLSPNASTNTCWVSAAVFFSAWSQIWCRFFAPYNLPCT